MKDYLTQKQVDQLRDATAITIQWPTGRIEDHRISLDLKGARCLIMPNGQFIRLENCGKEPHRVRVTLR